MIESQIFAVSRHRMATDGDGITTLVAFSGCPLRCRYCLNKASWDPERGRLYTPEELYETTKIDQLYFLATQGGVTFGGGEPMLHVDFIKAFRKLCGPQWKLHLETCLNVPQANVEALDAVVDGYFVDIKDVNPVIYKAYTGKDNAQVMSNLEWLLQQGDASRVTVRVPHIPDFNTDADVQASIERLKAMGIVNIDEFEYVIN